MSEQSNKRSAQSYESVWMSHWIRTSYNAPEQTNNPIQNNTFEFVNKSLKISSITKGHDTMLNPLFNYDQDTRENMLPLRPVFHNLMRRGEAWNGEGTSKSHPFKWFKSDSDAIKYSRFAMPKPLQELYVESSSQILPYECDNIEKYEFGKGKAAIVFKQLPNANTNCHSRSESLRIFGSMRVVTKKNGNSSRGFCRISPFFGRGNRGVKLESLSSSMDNEGKEDAGGEVKASEVTIRNDTSAETDTINIESSKAFTTSVPDINLKLQAILSEHASPSPSKTQSLDMDNLATNPEKPGSRWAKRLKLNSSNSFAQGTKRSDLPEKNLPHEKMSRFFNRILKSGITSEEDPMQPHKEDGVEKTETELLLSHAWIQRWLSNRSRSILAEKKAETQAVCELQSSKSGVNNLQKQLFPSIAAIALMGRAISGVQTCELQKRGSFTVWNTKAF